MLGQARLQHASNFFQASNRQMIGGAKRLFVVLPMNRAIGSPAPLSFSIGRKTARVADKAERGKRAEPLKPVQRIGGESQLPFVWADEHIGPSRPQFHPWDDARTSPQFAWLERSLEGALPLGSNDRRTLSLDGQQGCALGEQSLQRAQAAFIPRRRVREGVPG